MTREEIIEGLQFTIDMCLYDPLTGETFSEPRYEFDKTVVNACRGAIEALRELTELENNASNTLARTIAGIMFGGEQK